VPNPLVVTLHASAAEAASGSAASVDLLPVTLVPTRGVTAVRLEATAVSTSIEVRIETSTEPSGGLWRALYAQVLAKPTVVDFIAAPCDRYIRASWTLPAAATATFAVTGIAHVVYLGPNDVPLPGETKTTDTQMLWSEILSQSSEADGYLGNAYTLPLESFGSSLSRRVGAIVAYNLLSGIGFQPDGADEMILSNRNDALAWLRMVGEGKIKPPDIVDGTPTVSGRFHARVTSTAARGW